MLCKEKMGVDNWLGLKGLVNSSASSKNSKLSFSYPCSFDAETCILESQFIKFFGRHGEGAWGTLKSCNIESQKGKYRDNERENRQYLDTEKSSFQIYITSVTPVQHGPVGYTTTCSFHFAHRSMSRQMCLNFLSYLFLQLRLFDIPILPEIRQKYFGVLFA